MLLRPLRFPSRFRALARGLVCLRNAVAPINRVRWRRLQQFGHRGSVILGGVGLVLFLLPGAEPQAEPSTQMPGAFRSPASVQQVAQAEARQPLSGYFVSLLRDKVNVRVGPGLRFKIDWVYVRRFLPLEVVGTSENWRQVRDWLGKEGWIHNSQLSGRRTVLVTGNDLRSLHAQPEAQSPLVARLEPGVIGQLRDCRPQWCEIEVSDRRGWINRNAIWGVFSHEFLKNTE